MNGWEFRKERDLRNACIESLMAKSEQYGEDRVLWLVCDLLDTPILQSIESRISDLRIERAIKEGKI